MILKGIIEDKDFTRDWHFHNVLGYFYLIFHMYNMHFKYILYLILKVQKHNLFIQE